ncbi:MAG: transposase [Flavobacteriales bacterium]|jgi:transposase-like protein|nr:transposase [Flavobacteriales bacterium]
MSRRERRTFTAAFKTKVVLEALKERHTMSELAQMHDLHPNQITTWKKEFLQGAERVFEQPEDPDKQRLETERDELHRQLGQLTVEVNWLKKKLL